MGSAGSAKSYFITQKLIVRACKEPIRILVCRRTATTIRNTCFSLFKDILAKWKLTEFVKIRESDFNIKFPNGTAMSGIEFKGLDKVLKGLDLVANEEKIQRGLTKACLLVERTAKQKAPKGNGELRNSITHEVKGLVGEVYTPLEYAPYVEYGTGLFAEDQGRQDVPWCYQDERGEWHTTSGMHPQPYMRPAINENREEILRIIEESICIFAAFACRDSDEYNIEFFNLFGIGLHSDNRFYSGILVCVFIIFRYTNHSSVYIEKEYCNSTAYRICGSSFDICCNGVYEPFDKNGGIWFGGL